MSLALRAGNENPRPLEIGTDCSYARSWDAAIGQCARLIPLLHFLQSVASLLVSCGASLAVKLAGLIRILGDSASIAVQMSERAATRAIPSNAGFCVTVHHDRQRRRFALEKVRFVILQNAKVAARRTITCLASLQVEFSCPRKVLCNAVAKFEHDTEIVTSVRLPGAASPIEEGQCIGVSFLIPEFNCLLVDLGNARFLSGRVGILHRRRLWFLGSLRPISWQIGGLYLHLLSCLIKLLVLRNHSGEGDPPYCSAIRHLCRHDGQRPDWVSSFRYQRSFGANVVASV